jgi:hypothetical protein
MDTNTNIDQGREPVQVDGDGADVNAYIDVDDDGDSADGDSADGDSADGDSADGDANIDGDGDADADIDGDGDADADALIPCDICDVMVRFRDYQRHYDQCAMPMPAQPLAIMMQIINSQSSVNIGNIGNMIFRMAGEGRFDNVDNDEADEAEEDTDEDGPPSAAALAFSNGIRAFMVSGGGDYEMNLAIADMTGTVELGVEDYDSAVTKVVPDDTDAKCPVCQDDLVGELSAGGTTIVRTRRCNHTFCDPCMRTWLSRNTACPVCMCDLRPTEPAPLAPVAEDDDTTSASRHVRGSRRRLR